MNFTFLDGNKNPDKQMIQDENGYQYRVKAKRGTKLYYRCRVLKQHGCKASGVLVDNVFKGFGDHTHPVEKMKNTVKQIVRENLANAGKNPDVPQRNILANIVQEVSAVNHYAPALLPSRTTINQQIKRQRNRQSNQAKLPKDMLQDLEVIEDQYAYYNGAEFLFMNEVIDGDRIMAFMAPAGQRVLEESKLWSSDGTFSKTPAGFSQIYVVGGFVDGPDGHQFFRPAVFALLPR